jgi:hypothetical protein
MTATRNVAVVLFPDVELAGKVLRHQARSMSRSSAR